MYIYWGIAAIIAEILAIVMAYGDGKRAGIREGRWQILKVMLLAESQRLEKSSATRTDRKKTR